MIPMLVHEDCMDQLLSSTTGIDQELANIANDTGNLVNNTTATGTDVSLIKQNTCEIHEMGELIESESTIHDRLSDVAGHLENIEDTSATASTTLTSIQNELGAQSDAAGTNTISGQIKQISQSTGHPTDTSTENSVIGLLKSIANKL